MGLLDALIESSNRFKNEKLLPIGYKERSIRWIINIPKEDGIPSYVIKKDIKKGIAELSLKSPDTPSDRTSGNVSPSLLVDKVSYALGISNDKKKGDSKKIAKDEHKAFVALIEKCASETDNKQVERILKTIKFERPKIPEKEVKANDICAFLIEEEPWVTDDTDIQKFWSKYIGNKLASEERECALCRNIKPIVRILPFKSTLLKGTDSVQLTSFNKDSFCSGGNTTKSAFNVPICFDCAGLAGQILQFLLKIEEDKKYSGRHAVVLEFDNSNGKQPLKNQIAVFWTKEQLHSTTEEKREFEELIKLPIEQFDNIEGAELQSRASQCRVLLESPFTGKKNDTELQVNQFYLAVLSPNKSRLVVREWLEESIEKTHQNLKHYMDSLQIIHPNSDVVLTPPVPAIWDALQSYSSAKQAGKEKPRIPSLGPDAMRKLLRCIYTGTLPPETLLSRALRCFRIPDPPTDSNEHERRNRQMYRRMAMAATMKLILTYNENIKEQKAMEQLKTPFDSESNYKKKAPYNCGVLLAILEAIQRKASSSGRGVNTTLVDRYYSAASTAPAIIFANLINMATKAHLPKLRRENKEFFKVTYQEETININDLMTEVCKAIDDAGGFPPPLEPKEQAAFALGFYHQRATFAIPPKKNVLTKNNNPKETQHE